MRSGSRVPSLIACLLVIVGSFAGGTAVAQEAEGRIVGNVTDETQAAVVGARVTVTNVATQISRSTATDKNGFYEVLSLPIGSYKVTIEMSGFRKQAFERQALQINQSLRLDARLEVGQQSEVVEVTGQAANVETVNPTLGQSITSRPIVNLPLNGRNVLDLALLQPGVTEDNPDDGGSGQGFNIGGGRSDSITYLLDGGVNNDLMGNGVVLNPNPDAIAEFRILTSNYTAEYGRNGAGVISVVTKSGTNQIHGSAFDFVRNTDFDANAYFNIQEGLPRTDLKRHQFGGTLGGPISIPHLLEGKDRFFFFVSYQGQRQTQGVVESQITTFTPAELNGDFSQAAKGGPDPNVAAFLQGNPYFQSNPALAAQAIIDPTKFDPAAINYIKLGLIPTSTSGLVSSAAPSKNNNNELTGKVDLNFTSKDRFAITVGGFRNPQIDPFPWNGANVPGFPASSQTNNYFLNVAYTRTFSPNLLNEFRATAQRHYVDFSVPLVNLPTSAQLGFGILSDLPNGPPLMSFDNGLSFGLSPQGPAYEIGTTYVYSDALTWVRGHNTWKFGGGFSAYQNNTTYDFYGDGNYFFLGPYGSGGIGTGSSFADFLVGIPNNLFEAANAKNNIRSKATYGYLQDEWRARKNLTLTLGIRYEYSQPKYDTQGRTYSVIPGDQSTRFPNAPLGLVFPGDKGAPRGVNFSDKDNFAPRFGFAWDPTSHGKTSIRGGIGIFYDVLKGEDNLQFNGAPPFYSEPFAVFSPPNSPGGPYTYYSAPWTTAGFPNNPFPSTPPTAATAFVNGNSLPFGGGGIYFVNPHLRTPYAYQYNLSFQHEVARNLVAEANYVGSSSKGLTSLEDINPFDLSTITGPNPSRILNENQNAALTNTCVSFGGPSTCPFSVADEFANISFANFNSLETSLTKQNGDNRIFGNTYFTLAYTYGHSLDNASGFRNRSSQVPFYNPGQFHGSSDFDLTHRVTFSGGWDLPFDKLASGPKPLVKGWSLYPILSWRTGFPLTINSQLTFNPTDPGPSGAGDGYLANAVFAPGFNNISILNPKHTGSCNNTNTGSTDTGNLYFNCSAFVSIADVPGTGYGLPRNFFRGPGRTNLDMALAKATGITERVNAEFRVEAFNLFNHTEFANPDTNLFSGTFGQITSTTIGTLHTERILQLALRLAF